MTMAGAISLREQIRHITEGWFLTEPALFCIFCTHELCPNPNMQIPIRTGKGRIEYNEEKLSQLTSAALEEHLRVEMVRLFLKHPYERQPLGSRADALHRGSDLVIEPFYTPCSVKMLSPQIFNLPRNQSFEWYVRELNLLLEQFVSPPEEESIGLISDGGGASDDSGEKSLDSKPMEVSALSDDDRVNEQSQQQSGRIEASSSQYECTINGKSKEYTELWEEDDEKCQEINDLLTETIQDWGTLPKQLVETIKVATKGRVDYRRVLSRFRASIISSKRRLTRMKPSRRFGWMYMGSTFELSTKLLVAIDVSGSVTSETISYFLNVIQRFFRYGVSEIDIIQFDTEIKDKVMTLKEYSKHFKNGFRVLGRGGTNFQPIFNFLKEHNHYDGLIIFTDGYAPKPTIDFYTRTKVLWILEDDDCYQSCCSALESIGRVCAMKI